jgi:hypothetical protein
MMDGIEWYEYDETKFEKLSNEAKQAFRRSIVDESFIIHQFIADPPMRATASSQPCRTLTC